MSFLWKIGGEAGYGVMTTGLSISKVAARSGYHVWDYSEYPSLIRGGHNTYETHIDSEPVHSSKNAVDLLVCLNEETWKLHNHRLHDDSVTVYDPDQFTPFAPPTGGAVDPDPKRSEGEGVTEGSSAKGRFVPLPVKKILLEQRGLSVMANMITFGASLALMGADEAIYEGLIRETFAKKGDEVIDANLRMVKMGTDFIQENHTDLIQPILAIASRSLLTANRSMVIAGNESFGLGAVAADCRFYCSYPMTPASSVLTYLSAVAEKCGMVVKQAEDEISVINTALGSAFAGVRSAVGTSGGGFALMVESISLAGIIETPIVIFLAQRPGPATGVPTWTAQGDLLFAVHAGHGDFPKVVLAPGDVQEMVQLTLKAFDIADKYQIPVIVMSDKVLSESHQDFPMERFEALTKSYIPNRGKIISELPAAHSSEPDRPYLRYEVTDDGISPMLIPGTPGAFYQANSYEHLEDSHTTEDMKEVIRQVDKRTRKEQTYLNNDFALPKIFGDMDKAETVLVSWGGNKGVILDAMKELSASSSQPVAYIHFTHIYPLDEAKIKPLFEAKKRYILIDNNASGQFGRVLREQTGITIEEKLLKYDGQPIFREEIVARVKRS